MKLSEISTIKDSVRSEYGNIASSQEGCCGPQPQANSLDCCTPAADLGYSKEDMSSIPGEANLGLGCGNPQAIANLKKGETVLDLGSGAGIDVFLAAKAVGDSGFVIGVDMTPEMLTKARKNADTAEVTNVDFRLGEIENLPVEDNSVDAIISNCVINLSPEKQSVFSEAFRVLKPGGRLAIKDIIADTELPPEWKDNLKLYSGCVSGAATKEEITAMLKTSGFSGIQITEQPASKTMIKNWFKDLDTDAYIVSASIEAVKPAPI